VGKKRRKSAPLVSHGPPLVSGRVPLAGSSPGTTIVRHWGVLPSWKRVETTARRRDAPPSEFGLLHFITTAPMAPLRIVSAIATAVKEQAEEEVDARSQAQLRLLELQMRHEAGEIDDHGFAAQEKKLQEMLRHAGESKATTKKV